MPGNFLQIVEYSHRLAKLFVKKWLPIVLLCEKNRTSISYLPWFVWGLAATFYAYEFFLQVSPSVMVPELMHAFHLDAAGLGNLTALYIYSYATMQIPAGILLDIIGPRRLLTSATAICALGACLFGLAHELWVAQIGRLLIGFGSAFAAIGTFKLVTIWFPANRFALISGLTLTIGMMGAVFGSAPLSVLVEHLDWRNSMVILAVIGILVATLIWLVVSDSPKKNKQDFLVKEKVQQSMMKNLIHIFTQPQTWLIAIYGGLMFAPTPAFAGLWGTSFLMAKYGLSRFIAAGATSTIFIGWAIGSPLFGWFSDYIKQRKPTMYIAALGSMITMSIIIYVYLPLYLLYTALFLFGIFSSGFLPAFAVIREINPSNSSATALGFMNMLNMTGAAILQPLIGFILDICYDGGIHKHLHVRIYSLHAYHYALAVLPVILGLAIVLLPFIVETHCRPSENCS